jgi:hypothetical protein
MPDKAWKAWEREVARDLGGTRTGPTGRDTPDVSDVALIGPECKYQGKFGYKEADFTQARENAEKVGRMPALFLKERGGKRKRVVMDYLDYIALYKLAIGAQGEDSLPEHL